MSVVLPKDGRLGIESHKSKTTDISKCCRYEAKKGRVKIQGRVGLQTKIESPQEVTG